MQAVLLLGLLLHADATKDETGLVGTWVVTSAVADGKPFEELKGDKLIFDKDGNVTKKSAESEDRATYKIDPAQKPKTLDIKEPERDKPHQAIYTLDGDTLKICVIPEAGKPRPTEFTAKEGTGQLLIELKREKK